MKHSLLKLSNFSVIFLLKAILRCLMKYTLHIQNHGANKYFSSHLITLANLSCSACGILISGTAKAALGMIQRTLNTKEQCKNSILKLYF